MSRGELPLPRARRWSGAEDGWRTKALAPIRRVRQELLDPLLRGTYSLMLNSLATALLGLVFWVLAARLRNSHQVGQDSALIAAMMTLSSIFQLNLANTLTRFLPRAGSRTRRWVLGAYAIAVLATAAGALAFVLLVPQASAGLRFLGRDRGLALAFVGACALWSVFGLQDAVMTALRRAPWVPLENTIFGVLKVAFLPALVVLVFAHAVFVSWALPMILLLAPVNYLIFRRFIPAHVARHPEARPVSELLPSHRVRHFLVADYLGSVAQQAALALPTLLVIALIGSSANAYFYVPFMLVTSFDTLFFNPSVALVVEGAFDSASAAELVRRIVRRVGWLVLAGVVVMLLAAPLLLLPFGASYSAHGAATLRLLALASVFRIAISLFAAVARIEGRGAPILAVYAAVVALLVPLILLLHVPFGIEGVALAWLLANAIVALAVAPSLVRLLRAGEPLPALSRLASWTARLRELRAARAAAPPREGDGVPWRTLALASIAASIVAVALSLVGAPPGVRFAGLLAFLCIAPGTALLGALEPSAARLSPVAVLCTGLALGALGSQILLWLHLWRPQLALLLAAIGCLAALTALDRARRHGAQLEPLPARDGSGR